MRPEVTLKFAASLNGALDDAEDSRKIFSTDADFAEVQALRARNDAVLIGGETLRKDDPQLTIRSAELIDERKESGRAEQPLRVVLTRSGSFDPGLRLLREGEAPLIYTTAKGAECLQSARVRADVVRSDSMEVEISWLLADLSRRGIRTLLVEGGASILSEFLASGLFDHLRVAIAPEFIGDSNVPKLGSVAAPLELLGARAVGGLTVLEYRRAL